MPGLFCKRTGRILRIFSAESAPLICTDSMRLMRIIL